MNPLLALDTNHCKALQRSKGVKPQITQMPADQGPEYICANLVRQWNHLCLMNWKDFIMEWFVRNEIIITSIKMLYRLVRGFRSIVRQIATGFAVGEVFNGNSNREVITVLFLNAKCYMLNTTHYSLFIIHGYDSVNGYDICNRSRPCRWARVFDFQ